MVRVEERSAHLLEESERREQETSGPNCAGRGVQVTVRH